MRVSSKNGSTGRAKQERGDFLFSPVSNEKQKAAPLIGKDEADDEDPKTFWQQLWTVARLSTGPIVASFFFMVVQLVSTYFIGHLNEAVLISGVGMGNMLINVLAFATINGLNGALESLISNSYGASKNTSSMSENQRLRRQVGIFYNRGRFVSSMVMIPIALIFIFSDKLLVLLH